MARIVRKRTEAMGSIAIGRDVVSDRREDHIRDVVELWRANGDFSISRVQRGKARMLITLGPNHAMWRNGATWIPSLYAGALVRLVPPAEATEAEIQANAETLRANGASAVRVMPKAASETVGLPKAPLAPAKPYRAIVMELVEQAATEDREGLRGAVIEALMRAGL
jgi:hypothetical protein